jgi:hypothetical protein
MNAELRALVKELGLNNPEMKAIRYKFCFACASRIAHLLELDEAIAAYKDFESYLNGELDRAKFDALQKTILEIANKHPGSKSIDGTKHSAVSATYALANAINGNPVSAAEYAAYSKTYGYGGYAVSDLESYQEEYVEQVKILRGLLDEKYLIG